VAIQFDENNIIGARFGYIRRDAWFRLSNAYLGIFQYINLSLSGLYLGLLLLKLYLFKFLSIAQSDILNTVNHPIGNPEHLQSVSVFNFVFGAKWTSALPAIIILIYQMMRIFLTVRISPLIESERITGWTPPRSSYQRYMRLHLIAQILAGVAIMSFAWEVWQLFQQDPLLILRTHPKG
jgi:hypothetical protein